MSVVRQRLVARLDLIEAIAYLAGQSETAARRFRAEAETTFGRLRRATGHGRPVRAG